jgi:predicted ribosome quality control (RQC) complex YloA/Tae2 family protein
MREFPSVNDGVRTVVSVKSQAQGSDQEQDGLMKKLLARRERLEKSLRTTRQQVDESRRAAEYTRNGNLLMANLHLMSKGPDAIEVEDILGDGGKVRIALSASLTPAENAERYFTRARKARGSGEEAATRVKEIERDLASLEAFIARFAGCVDDEERERFRKEHGDDLAAMNITEKPAVQERVPYRIFAVPGGYEVWVGKSSSDNDELTFHYAKQQDLWFHVRGASGSHAILRVPGKDQVVPKEAILAAARIAAYYSKMKNANTVPVAYCERKYVRKPKGAKPGTVTLEREKVVFVDPSLP